MSHDLKTHDPSQISIGFAGRQISSGRADEFCTTAYNEPLYTTVASPDGEIVRVKSNNRSAKITLTLKSTSSGHKLMTQLLAIGQLSVNGSDIGEFQLRDRNGGLVEHAEKAWISKAPDNANGKDVSDRAWELECSYLVREAE